MSYEVRCACGNAHAVEAADAGAALRCACGQVVEVPPLHRLRSVAGEPVLSAAVRIETLLLEGSLPGTRACAVCCRDTGDLVHVAVECERGRTVAARGPSQEQVVAGCLIGAFIGVLAGFLMANRLLRRDDAEGPKQVGQDVAFTLPLPVCGTCRPGLSGPAALVRALRTIPDYAALLDRYPKARVQQVK